MAESKQFSFRRLEGKKFPGIESSVVKALLEKWYVKQRMRLVTFNYDEPFQIYEKEAFTTQFFSDANVTTNLMVPTDDAETWTPLGTCVTRVVCEQIPCTVFSMDFFDRLKTEGVVRETGAISKCFDEVYESFIVADELRKVLLMEDEEKYCIFNDKDRDEFIFRIFQHLCLGGAICQYEDTIEPYLNTTRTVYKDLMTVVKDPETRKLSVTSWIFKVEAYSGEAYVFPGKSPHRQNYCYLIIDPLKRHVTVWYHDYGRGLM
ncbi:cilia- and flagella-associated protein 300-like isoform X1 [Corticium candelabrum]|uniref:cilia- and flagella-associated protein 300-like isoform X1 n=1 Tax=Corticium candelabrum TaxID=121492 RepID=UPI002E27368A|nr:cilia- and flagella-associated protein 300-like isoform X1 [Corticium candelabrum]